MSEELIESVKEITKSRNRRGIGQIEYIITTLEQASPIFANVQKKGVIAAGEISNLSKGLDLRKMDKQEQIVKVLERFQNEFKILVLPLTVTIKEYVLFLVVCLKLVRRLKDGRQKSLYFAETLAALNSMFVRNPVQYNKRALKEPLELLFLVTEFVNQATRGLESPYVLDEIIMSQFVTLMTKYCTDSKNPLLEIVKDVSEIPKFRLDIPIGREHTKTIENILQYCFPKISLQIRIETVRRLLDLITNGKNDSDVLMHYDALKMLASKQDDLREPISELVNAQIKNKHNRFVSGILEELRG